MRAKPVVWICGAAAVALSFLLPLVFGEPERVVRFLSDDAFYYLGVARHVAEGRGPTFDTITRTTGFHPLWMFLLAVRPGVPWALGLGTFLFLATAVPLGCAARALWGERAGWVAAWLWLANPHAVLLVATGMEGSLYAALLASLAWALTRVARVGSWSTVVIAGSAAGLAVVARTDGLLVVPLAALWLAGVGDGGPTRRAVRSITFGALALVPFALWLAWAHAWTGRWIQGSADTKTLWREAMNAEQGAVALTLSLLGAWVVKAFVKVPALKWGIPFVASAVSTAIRGGRGLVHGFWLLPLLAGAAYALLLPKLWGWYFASALVGLTLLAAAAILRWFERQGGKARGLLALAIVLIGAESIGYLAVKSVRGRNAYQVDMLATAHWMRDHLPPGTVAAAWNSGIYGWYSGLTVVNLDGLINNEIADRIRSGETQEAYLERRGIEVLVDYDTTVEQLDTAWRERHLTPLFRRPRSTRNGKDITVWGIRGKGDWHLFGSAVTSGEAVARKGASPLFPTASPGRGR